MSIIDLLDRWGLTNCIKGLCFDTTASNSGKLNFNSTFDKSSLLIHYVYYCNICIYHKVDRLAVLVSGLNFEQLLGIPKIESGTGEHQAMSIIDLLDRWGLTNCIKGLCFDTTASNSDPETVKCFGFS
ncbi:uncharacterized protein LOC141535036 [Cotesia typhae]|uniref:uncharacterized protein LOC141535036 n=1 Tax=Cotesia typhae TaxID=2053667 RepID=UPI003D6827D6